MVTKKKTKKPSKVAKSNSKLLGEKLEIADFPTQIQDSEFKKSEPANDISIEDVLKAPFAKGNRRQLLVGGLVLSLLLIIVLFFVGIFASFFVQTLPSEGNTAIDGAPNSPVIGSGLVVSNTMIIFIISIAIALIFIGLFIQGYVGQWIKNILNKDLDLPVWKNWKELIKVGFGMLVVSIIYCLLPYLIYIISMYAFGEESIVFAVIDILINLVLIALIPFIAIAIIHYIDKKSISVAFDLKFVWREFKSKISNYIIAFCVYFAVCLVLIIVAVISVIALISVGVALTSIFVMANDLVILMGIFVGIIFGLFAYCVVALYISLIMYGLFARVYTLKKQK